MGVDPKKLAAFANAKKEPGKSGKPGGFPFGKGYGKKGKGPLQEWAKEEEEEPEHGGEGGKDGEGIDVVAIGDRVQSGDGDPDLMEKAQGITEETNPPDAITDEAIWEKAKAAVEPHWDDYDEPYAVVMHVYKEMGGGFSGGKGSVDDDLDEDDDVDEGDEDYDMDGGGGA